MFIAHYSWLTAQSSIDSLLNELKTTKEDTIKVNLLNTLSWEYHYSDYDKANEYAQQALQLSNKVNYKKGVATSFYRIGIVHHLRGNYAKALEYYQKSLIIKEELRDKKGIAKCLMNIGSVHFRQDNYTKTLEYYQKSLIIKEELGDKQGVSTTLNNIGNVHISQGNYTKAIEYYQESLKIKKELGDKHGISSCLNNIGNVHRDQGNYTKALNYYQGSLKISEELGDKKAIANTLSSIGFSYTYQGNYTKAIEYNLKSLKIAKEIGAKNIIRENYVNLSESYAKQDNYKEAYEYHKLFKEMHDNIYNENTSKQLHEMEERYQSVKRQQQIELQEAQLQKKDMEIKQQKILRNILIGGLSAIVIVIVLIVFAYIQKRKDNIRITRQKEKILAANEELNVQKEELQSILESFKKTQSQLVQSEKMASVGQLTAGIAHEINNPVTFVSAGVDSLITDLKEINEVLELYHKITPDNIEEKLNEIEELKEKIEYKEALTEVNKLIESIKNGAERTTEIVKGLRTFSRLDEDVLKIADIHDGLDSTLIMLRNRYKHNIEIIKDYGDIPKIECYPGQLNQVFMNILSNAIDAIQDKGKITIKTFQVSPKDQAKTWKGSSKPEEYLQISIKDTGKGMSENVKSKIFDPFFTTKDVGEGTGLGLSITHGIIEKHKGKIEVKSKERKVEYPESVGGTEFIISLPLKQA